MGAPQIACVRSGKLTGAAEIGAKADEDIGKYKMAKHLTVTITDDSSTIERKGDQIQQEALLDGIYVIRTPVPETELDAAGTPIGVKVQPAGVSASKPPVTSG